MNEVYDSWNKQEYTIESKWELLPMELIDFIIDILILSNTFISTNRRSKNILKICNKHFYKTVKQKIIDNMMPHLYCFIPILPEPLLNYPFLFIDHIQNIKIVDFNQNPIIIGYDQEDRRFIAFLIINEHKLITIHFLMEKYNNGSSILNDPIIITSKWSRIPPYYVSPTINCRILSDTELYKIIDILNNKKGHYSDLKIYKYKSFHTTLECQLCPINTDITSRQNKHFES